MTNRPKRYVATHPLMKGFQFVIEKEWLIEVDGRITGFIFPEQYIIDRHKPLTHQQLLDLNVGVNLIAEISFPYTSKKVNCYKNTCYTVTSEDTNFGTSGFNHVWDVRKAVDSRVVYYDLGERDVKWFLSENQPIIALNDLPQLFGAYQ